MPPGIPKRGYHNNIKVDLFRRIDDAYQISLSSVYFQLKGFLNTKMKFVLGLVKF